MIRRRPGPQPDGLMVDDEDAHFLSESSWSVSSSGYLQAKRNGRVVLLHREIMAPPSGMVVDHINHDKLDNRRSNLRVVSRSYNSQNRLGADRDSRTRCRGVRLRNYGLTDRYIAQGTIGRRPFYLGAFDTLEQADKGYDLLD